MENSDIFNFAKLKEATGVDPFANKTNNVDNRFFKLTRDQKTEAGSAVIRFLPDCHKTPFITLIRINAKIKLASGKERFVSEWSPLNINEPCPFNEEFVKLYNQGKIDEAKQFGRSFRSIANIKVISDPGNPSNNGKIFLLDMSKSLVEKIEKYLQVTEADAKLGAVPRELFNPFKGFNFKLSVALGPNKIPEYNSSEPFGSECSIYNSIEEGIEDIKANAYDLTEFKKPEFYKSYDELMAKLKYLKGDGNDAVTPVVNTNMEIKEVTSTVTPVAVTPVAVTPTTVQISDPQKAVTSGELDDLLKDLS